MQLVDIIRQVRRDLEEEPDADDIVDWANRCLDDLTSIVKKEAKQTYTIDSNNAYPLPPDFHDFAYLIIGGEQYYPVTQDDFRTRGFKVWGGTLSIQEGPTTGTMEFYYFRKLARLTTTNTAAEPEIDEPFHDLLILYAVGQLQFTEEDYDDRPDFMQRYYARKVEYSNYVMKKRRKGRTIEKVVW
ncbi:hypothetical protein ABH14_00360 [Brevibacillus brevis]|uniref:phage adaptor protein n=1 Tax=Brevibacillus brevis TaxID=1393 RepID=UPI0018FFC4F9|nr:hypothetical protein [Brevibacillus brevis]MBH0328264.1 hypothetical protein [Brevibacillus brevis]